MTESPLQHPALTKERLSKTAIVYLRQSTLGQVEENWGSGELQRRLVEKAEAYGCADVLVIGDDMGKSGSRTEGRLGWQDMMLRIRAGLAGTVFAYDVKRLSREVRDFSELIHYAREHNVALVLDGRVLDPRDPGDAAQAYVMATFAELDNRTRADLFRQTRRQKAEKGAIVSSLPVGWVKLPSGVYDFDPETKPTIEYIHDLYRRTGSVRRTVRVLNDEGVKVPTRYRGRKLRWEQATQARVTRLLRLEAYAGIYTYGKTEHQPEFGKYPGGLPRRRPVAESKQVRVTGLFPAYITPEERTRFLEQMAASEFHKRDRAGQGVGLVQGKLVCGECGDKMTPCYVPEGRGAHRYQCTYGSAKTGADPCMSVQGAEVDAAVERAFLSAVSQPTQDSLRAALEAEEGSKRSKVDRLEAERERLAYVEHRAEERYGCVDPRNRLVAAELEAQWEKAKKERKAFEEYVALNPPPEAKETVSEQLEELCRIVADVPALWSDDAITNVDRKLMLACLIDRVMVTNTAESIELSILWNSGVETQHRRWRRAGVDRLIADWHAAGKTAAEIQKLLEVGDPTTGQTWPRTKSAVYQALRRLGLRPNPGRQTPKPERDHMRELFGRGLTLPQIAEERNAAGSRTPFGRLWNANGVYNAIGGKLGRFDRHEDLHREVLDDAKRRGLTNKQAAEEFNAREIPRVTGRQWTADAVRQRRRFLNRKTREGAAKPSPDQKATQPDDGGSEDE